MNAAEWGLLLLRCRLSPEDCPLTQAQMRSLQERVRAHGRPLLPVMEVDAGYLRSIGCTERETQQVLARFAQEDALRTRLRQWRTMGITVCTAKSVGYPGQLLRRLGGDAPPVLFLRGDPTLLRTPCISVVGARELLPENTAFAAEVGRLAAGNGLTLVSGNARGADRAAQDACLKAGGAVIAFVADRLLDHPLHKRVLYVTEEVPEADFTVGRALARNRLIHAQGACVFAAQCASGSGGTWRGTTDNLARGYSPVYIFADGSEGAAAIKARGGVQLSMETLRSAGFIQGIQTLAAGGGASG